MNGKGRGGKGGKGKRRTFSGEGRQKGRTIDISRERLTSTNSIRFALVNGKPFSATFRPVSFLSRSRFPLKIAIRSLADFV